MHVASNAEKLIHSFISLEHFNVTTWFHHKKKIYLILKCKLVREFEKLVPKFGNTDLEFNGFSI